MQCWNSAGKVLEQYWRKLPNRICCFCSLSLSKSNLFPHGLHGRIDSFAIPLYQNKRKTVWASTPHQLFLLTLSIEYKYFSKRRSISMLKTMKNRHARTLFHFKLQTLSHLISKTCKRPGGLCSNLRRSATKSVLAV